MKDVSQIPLKDVIMTVPDYSISFLLDKAVQQEESELIDYLLDVMNDRKQNRLRILKESKRKLLLSNSTC
jgi:hypothetical protein